MKSLGSRYAADSGATFIIPFDADEIWWSTEKSTISELLKEYEADKISAPHYDYMPPEKSQDVFFPADFKLRKKLPNAMPKTAFRAHRKAIVLMGNHWVNRPGNNGTGLAVAHYPFRSKQQLYNKIKVGAAAINSLSKNDGLGVHWTEWDKMSPKEFDQLWESINQNENVIEDPELKQLRP